MVSVKMYKSLLSTEGAKVILKDVLKESEFNIK
jgi:hypothetical protein